MDRLLMLREALRELPDATDEQLAAFIRERYGVAVTARFIPGGRSVLTISSGITHQPRIWFMSWIARPHSVVHAMTLRIGGYCSRRKNHTHGRKINIDGMCTLA